MTEYSSSDLSPVARPRVIDVSPKHNAESSRQAGGKKHSRRRRRNEKTNVAPLSTTQQWPLEALPIQRVVIEYGRRTAAIQAQNDAQTLRNLINRIRVLGIKNELLENVLYDVEEAADRLQKQLTQAYADDE